MKMEVPGHHELGRMMRYGDRFKSRRSAHRAEIERKRRCVTTPKNPKKMQGEPISSYRYVPSSDEYLRSFLSPFSLSVSRPHFLFLGDFIISLKHPHERDEPIQISQAIQDGRPRQHGVAYCDAISFDLLRARTHSLYIPPLWPCRRSFSPPPIPSA